jgi:branched-chain amino acid aminotransferase
MSAANQFVSFNRDLCDAADARFPALSQGALYGKGVFTTLAVADGEPVFLEKHLRRLADHAERIGIDPGNIETIGDSLRDLIAANRTERGRARITLFDSAAGPLWAEFAGPKTSVLITTARPREVPAVLRIAFSPYPISTRSPLIGIKSCNYLENIAALDAARHQGCHEAIRLNERDEIVSAAMANVFWIKNDVAYTPELATGCLAGTTREFVIEEFKVEEVRAGTDAIGDADAIVLTSAGIGACRAQFSDNSPVPNGVADAIVTAVQRRLNPSYFKN